MFTTHTAKTLCALLLLTQTLCSADVHTLKIEELLLKRPMPDTSAQTKPLFRLMFRLSEEDNRNLSHIVWEKSTIKIVDDKGYDLLAAHRRQSGKRDGISFDSFGVVELVALPSTGAKSVTIKGELAAAYKADEADAKTVTIKNVPTDGSTVDSPIGPISLHTGNRTKDPKKEGWWVSCTLEADGEYAIVSMETPTSNQYPFGYNQPYENHSVFYIKDEKPKTIDLTVKAGKTKVRSIALDQTFGIGL